jgi:hypothetical protein
MRLVVAWSIVAPWLLAAATAQQERWSVDGEVLRQAAGAGACWLSDLDGDGVRDFAIGLLPGTTYYLPQTGGVRLCSGADGATIREWIHPDRVLLGQVLANGGDLDRDGFDDLLVGAPAPGYPQLDSAVLGYSGATGAQLFDLRGGVSSLTHFGASLAKLGDLDGDGTPDFALGVANIFTGGPAGYVELRSGRDQSVLGTVTGRAGSTNFGDYHRIAAAGDVDRDGVQDLLTAETFTPTSAGLPNCNVDVWSGATRAPLLQVTVSFPDWIRDQQLCVAGIGDADGDGTPDLLVSGPRTTTSAQPGRALLISGATGATLQTLFDSSLLGLGWLCFAAGDVDFDGRADFGVSGQDVAGHYVTIRSGATGNELLRMVDDAPGQQQFATALAAGEDVDGDGISELLLGCLPTNSGTGPHHGMGCVQCRSLADDSLVHLVEGGWDNSYRRSGVAFVDDQDGDGLPELVMTDSSSYYCNVPGEWELVMRSGSDGRELRRVGPTAPLMGPFVALPDVNGDGIGDFAASGVAWWAQYIDLVFGVWYPYVEDVDVRSGADLSLIRTLRSNVADESFGWALATGVQPGGAVHVACGAPMHRITAGGNAAGSVSVFDAATGQLVFAVDGDPVPPAENFGTAIAFVGDVNGDGTGDWAVGGPGSDSWFQGGGRVALISGVDGALIRDLKSAYNFQQMGITVVAMGDHDGDGIDELAVHSTQADSLNRSRGRLELFASRNWAAYATLIGTDNQEHFGRSVVAVPDMNGDGEDDFVVGISVASSTLGPRLELRSGKNGKLLRNVEPGFTSYSDPWIGAAPPPWLPPAPPKADGPWLASVDVGGSAGGSLSGNVTLHELDDLYLELRPPIAPVNANVTAATRGGPTGSLVGLFLAAIDGNPVGQFLAFGALDASGAYTVAAVVPPGLSGQEWELIGFAIGWNGKLVDSQRETIEFQ